MSGRHLGEGRLFLPAAFGGTGTAFTEPAARFWIDRAGDFALQMAG